MVVQLEITVAVGDGGLQGSIPRPLDVGFRVVSSATALIALDRCDCVSTGASGRELDVRF